MRRFLLIFFAALICATSMEASPAVAVNGKLPNAFSVSDTKKVYFSSGNLQYTKSTGKWKIMDHQYDMVETLSQNVGTDYADQDVVTLFGWGTSGWNNTAADATSVHYQPYATCNTNHSTLFNISYQYGPSLANVADGESWSKEVAGNHPYENYDWGVFNSGDLGAGWRTLTNAEWGYLFNTRTPGNSVNGVSNARYTEATINTDGTAVNGIILFPDDAVMTTVSGVTWGIINSHMSAWGTKCTSAGWTALETAGCVFLPAAGRRDGASVGNVGSYGNYWSSSASSARYAHCLYFYSGYVSPQSRNDRYYGCSVRLVSETAPPTPATVTAAPTAKSETITYNGSGQALFNTGTASGGTMKYQVTTTNSKPGKNSGTWSNNISNQTNAGTYYLWYYVKGDANHLDTDVAGSVTKAISKATPTVTAPTPKSLTYTGSAQTLVNTGSTTGGTLQYKLGSGSWGTSIPTATAAGNYTVYYKVEGNSNYNAVAEQSVSVTINKAPLTCTADNKSVTYGDAAPTYTATYSGWVNSETQAVLTGTLAFACDYSAGSDVDDYTITPSGVTSGNYTITFNTGTLTVNKADAVITDLPAAIEGLVYTGSAQTLISAGAATGGELQYKVDASAWSTDLPQATAIGDHTVYYKVVGDGNHNSIDESSFTVSIAAVTVLYDNTDPTTDIAGMVEAGEEYDLTVSRTIYADGYFNTICLPFAVSAGELSNPAHPLYGYTDLKAFSGAEVTGSGQNLFINIYVEDATEIAAGVPYLISYPGNRADILNPTFPAAVCTATTPGAVTRDGVTFQGMFVPVHITTYAENTTEDYLFLGENNRLLWPNDDGSSMRGFRAYFIIHRNNIPAAAAPRGTAARIMQRDNTATGIEQVQGDEVQSAKLLRDGQLIIIRNGVEYNANGQMLK